MNADHPLSLLVAIVVDDCCLGDDPSHSTITREETVLASHGLTFAFAEYWNKVQIWTVKNGSCFLVECK